MRFPPKLTVYCPDGTSAELTLRENLKDPFDDEYTVYVLVARERDYPDEHLDVAYYSCNKEAADIYRNWTWWTINSVRYQSGADVAMYAVHTPWYIEVGHSLSLGEVNRRPYLTNLSELLHGVIAAIPQAFNSRTLKLRIFRPGIETNPLRVLSTHDLLYCSMSGKVRLDVL